MNGRTARPGDEPPRCSFCIFGLIVTGKGEEESLPGFFRSLMTRSGCSFVIVRRIGQRNPITSPLRRLRMVGSGQVIPTEDEQDIAIPARRFLRQQPCRFVVLIDDVEHDRRPVISQIFARYRTALDTLLTPDERQRAAVHFFANMVEAYFFAHNDAVNNGLKKTVLAGDFTGDVETIPHPKNQLKHLFPGFDEIVHGAAIISRLDLDRVLSDPHSCAFLRSLIRWCVTRLVDHCPVYDQGLPACFSLTNGIQAPLTAGQ